MQIANYANMQKVIFVGIFCQFCSATIGKNNKIQINFQQQFLKTVCSIWLTKSLIIIKSLYAIYMMSTEK